MKPRLFLLFFSLLFPLSIFAQQQYVVTTQELNVRTAPSANSKVVDKVRQGDVVTVVSINNGWAKIVYKKQERYVSSKYLSKVVTNDTYTQNNNYDQKQDIIVLKNGHAIVGKVIEVNRDDIIYQPEDENNTSSISIAAVQCIRYANGAQKNFSTSFYQPQSPQDASNDLTTQSDFKRWRPWMRIGPGNTKLLEDLGSDGLSLFSVHLGASYSILPNVPLRFGLGYVERFNSNRYAEIKMKSLDLPIKIGYIYPFSSNFALMIQGGLSVDYLLSGYQKIGENSSSREKYSFEELADDHNFKYDDFGFGANATFSICLWEFEISAEYGIGFNKRIEKKKEKYWSVGFGWGWNF